MQQLDLRINERFKLERKLGQGGFGAVYLATDLETHELVVVKLEKSAIFPSLVQSEEFIYQKLGNSTGFPKVFGCIRDMYYTALVLELLGPPLEDLFSFCGRLFSLKTTLMLADQLIHRIEHVHSKGVVHRDLKPENFLMGRGRSGNVVYITDFGIANNDFHRNMKGDPECKIINGFMGSHRFACIRSHQHLPQTRRDDMESLGYILLYFLRGRLPWDSVPRGDKLLELTGEMKKSTSVEDLCAGAPKEFLDYFRHIRSLGFTSKPDYSYLRRILRNLFLREGFEYDNVFDWTIRTFFLMEEDKERTAADDGTQKPTQGAGN